MDAKEDTTGSRIGELLGMIFETGVVEAIENREDYAPVHDSMLPNE